MNKNRYLLYLLVCGLMLYYALPRISFESFGKESIFSAAWLLFALFVIAGNLSAFLYTPRKQKLVQQKLEMTPKKSRGYEN